MCPKLRGINLLIGFVCFALGVAIAALFPSTPPTETTQTYTEREEVRSTYRELNCVRLDESRRYHTPVDDQIAWVLTEISKTRFALADLDRQANFISPTGEREQTESRTKLEAKLKNLHLRLASHQRLRKMYESIDADGTSKLVYREVCDEN